MNKFVDQKDIKQLQSFIDSVGVDVIKYNFRKNINIKIGKIRIVKINNEIMKYLDADVTCAYDTDWKDSPTKILIHDIKNDKLNCYYYIVFNNKYYLLREYDDACKIFDTEYDINIIDKKYIIIMTSNSDTFVYSNHIDNKEYEIVDLTSDDENEDELVSLSLFDDEDIFAYE
jgi:hypothetical protein